MVRFTESQRGVAVGMAAGFCISAACLAAAAGSGMLGGFRPERGLRLSWFALSALAPALTLAVAIGRLAAYRFRSARDIDGSALAEGTDKARLLQSLLQNTLEQLALALPVYAAWSACAPVRWLMAMPVAAALFVLGRTGFFCGYRRGAAARSLGFALTFYPTLMLLAGAMFFAIRAVAG